MFDVSEALGAHFWSLWARFGGPWAHYGRLPAHFGSLGLHIEVFWFHLGTLGRLGHPKLIQTCPGWQFADIVETYENCSVCIGFRGWRSPSWHQNDILEALTAHVVCLAGCLDDVHGFS